jgi:hypothetical protein
MSGWNVGSVTCGIHMICFAASHCIQAIAKIMAKEGRSHFHVLTIISLNNYTTIHAAQAVSKGLSNGPGMRISDFVEGLLALEKGL